MRGRELDLIPVGERGQADDDEIQVALFEHGGVIGKHRAAPGGILIGKGVGMALVAAAKCDEFDLIVKRDCCLGMLVSNAAAAQDSCS